LSSISKQVLKQIAINFKNSFLNQFKKY